MEARQGGAGTREPSTWEVKVGGVMGLRLTMVHMHWGVQLQLRYLVRDPFSKKNKTRTPTTTKFWGGLVVALSFRHSNQAVNPRLAWSTYK